MWNRDFSLLTIAELLLCTACYTTIPLLPYRLYAGQYVSMETACLTVVLFVAGICLSGFFGCWLIQRYRRNKVFFVSTVCLAATIMAMSAFDDAKGKHAQDWQIMALMCTCTIGGIAFGHAKRVLSCTLMIDKTESCHRTEANYAAIWIARLAIVAGPIIALQLHDEMQSSAFYGACTAIALAAALLVITVKFPFRAPEEETKILSIDRFFLPQGWNVATVIALMSAALGIIISAHTNTEFLCSLVAGFVISIIMLRYRAVREGRYTSAIGNACILAAVAAMVMHDGLLDNTLKPMILGIGFGATGSEQLYKLLDRCDHCQRSTAESTYFMASDGGLFLGLAAGWSGLWNNTGYAVTGEQTTLLLFVTATVMCSINALVKKKHIEHRA